MANGAATIFVGGRWRKIEEENEVLQSELAESRRETAVSATALRCAEAGLEAAARTEEKLRAELSAATADATCCGQSLAASRLAFDEVSEAVALANCRAAELAQARSILSEEAAQLHQALDRAQREACGARTALAASEQRISLERSCRGKAESRGEHLEAEVAVGQNRLVAARTHVELLLREKERLWGQLARSRRQGEGIETSSASRKASRPCSTGPPARSASQASLASPVKKGAPAVAVPSPKGTASGSPSAAELERKLWHTQKALERERASHENTRLALMGYQGWAAEPAREESAYDIAAGTALASAGA
eukprot:TRINITY_DN83657_c0_g1_i1.p1 TRINITY_DN83657_c0_g1~~TRINITY_DN83657_c0_g1_i1.p1  ORF type:complete len:311 (-),score=79.28 TRINITY_DN83657_c0_g1_i1:70-1002(-)